MACAVVHGDVVLVLHTVINGKDRLLRERPGYVFKPIDRMRIE